ncbi:DUF1345 domain-containing protein [Pseudoduganella danionis]|uniref:DUF1345 domain-containing protein n=1 Tax=Pseudoduganella danionis TaxID=1890295 RepID=A0ABW9SMF5_9BURK|nr:DUF1345 domain-containing protein [Pseudoduganella danionis]
MSLPLPRIIHTRPHLSAALALGAATGLLLPASWPVLTRLLTAWNTTVWSYLLMMAVMMARADHHDIRRTACRQDEKGPVILSMLSLLILASLAAIVSQLSVLKDAPPQDMWSHYGFVVLTLAGSWFMIGTMFCSHYAHLFYINHANGEDSPPVLQFPDQNLVPNYWDFLYFSFTISVAAQTADVSIHSRELRKVVLGQSVLCFFYNLAVLGLSINIGASLINA